MKKQMLMLLALGVLVFAGGCIPTTAQIETATNRTDSLMVFVDKLQDTVNVLVRDGIIESEKVKSISKEIDRAQEDIVVVNEAIKEKTDQGVLEAAKAGWGATKDFNPYYGYGALVLTILGEAGAIYQTTKKNKNLEKGVNRVKGEADPELAKKIHDTIKIYTG